MKIMLASPIWGYWGGREQYVINCVREFRALGHSCSILYGRRSTKYEQLPLPEIPAYELPAYTSFASASDADETHALDAALEREAPDAVFLSGLRNFALLSRLRQYGHLAPISHDNGLVCLRTCNITYVRKCACTHALGHKCLLHGCMVRRSQTRSGFVYNSLGDQQRLLQEYREIGLHLVPSRYTEQRLQQHGFLPHQTKVVGSFVDIQPDASVIATKESGVVVFVGRVDRYKGVDYLLRALTRVHTPFRCVVVGDGDHLSYCRALAVQLGISRVTAFPGWLPREDIARHLRSATLAVVPSLLPEAMGLSVLEAMMCSKPVVAFDSGAIGEVVQNGKTGIVVPVKDTLALAQGIELLLRNPARAAVMGSEARSLAMRIFSRERHIATLLDCFRHVAAQ